MGRVRQRVMDVRVPYHKGRVGGFGRSDQRGHCHLRHPFGPKIIQVQNTKVDEGLPKQVYPKHIMGDYIRPVEKCR